MVDVFRVESGYWSGDQGKYGQIRSPQDRKTHQTRPGSDPRDQTTMSPAADEDEAILVFYCFFYCCCRVGAAVGAVGLKKI